MPYIVYVRKYDYKRKITLTDLLDSNIEIIYSTLNAPVHCVFCLDLNMYDHKFLSVLHIFIFIV